MDHEGNIINKPQEVQLIIDEDKNKNTDEIKIDLIDALPYPMQRINKYCKSLQST